jgi:hypothetical protein
MAEIKIEGFKELNAVLDNLPKQLSRRAKVSAGRKAARPIVSRARQIIKTEATKSEGNFNGFRHLWALARFTKVESYKGVVNIKIGKNAPDVPMTAKGGSRFWPAWQAAFLFAFGRQSEGEGSRFKKTGFTEGFGDWITQSGKEKAGFARFIYLREIEKATINAIDKAVRRYGKRN